MYFLLNIVIFHCYVSLPEGMMEVLAGGMNEKIRIRLKIILLFPAIV